MSKKTNCKDCPAFEAQPPVVSPPPPVPEGFCTKAPKWEEVNAEHHCFVAPVVTVQKIPMRPGDVQK